MTADWPRQKLSEVCEIGAGNSAPQKKEYFADGKFPFFRTSDVGSVRVSLSLSQVSDYLNEKGIKGLKLFPKGTILLPKSGASTFLNHRVIMGVDGYVASHLATILPNAKFLNNTYLFYFLLEIRAQDLIQDHKYPSLNLAVLNQIEIPLPPLPEQNRLVKILDEVFEKVERAKDIAERNAKNAREIFESYLEGVFEKKGEGWVEKKLGEVCEKITDGTHQTPKYFDKGIIFLSSRNVKERKIDWNNIKFIDDRQHREMHKRVAPRVSDILLAKNGTTGVAAMVDRDVVFDIYVSLALLRAKEGVLPEFLLLFVNSSAAKKQFNKRLKGSGVPNLHLEEIREVEISFPASIDEQKTIVSKSDSLSAETKKLEAIYKQKLANLEELKKSVLRKAFAGEL